MTNDLLYLTADLTISAILAHLATGAECFVESHGLYRDDNGTCYVFDAIEDSDFPTVLVTKDIEEAIRFMLKADEPKGFQIHNGPIPEGSTIFHGDGTVTVGGEAHPIPGWGIQGQLN